MKKLIIAIALIAITLSGCKKTNSTTKMNGIEFTNKYKFQLPFLDYGNGSAKSNKPKANAVTLSVTEDLTLSGSITCTVSDNAQWGGIQKFLAIPLDIVGAISYCNFYDPIPNPMNCPTTASGVYRGWTSDNNYDVHLSNTVTIP
jgi:hypothetical protein